MKYYIKDQESGLYVGSHLLPGYKGSPFFKLQDLEHAYLFNTIEEAKISLNLLQTFSQSALEIKEE